MKKVLYKIFISILSCFIFQISCIATQYSNNAIQLYNQGVMLHQQGKYKLSEQKYIQAINIQPDFSEAKNNLGAIYQALANKAFEQQDYNNAADYTKKHLGLNPNDEIAKQNLQITNSRISDQKLNDSINNLNVSPIDTVNIYHLINNSHGVSSDYTKKMKTILDLIYSEPNGKILLSALPKHKASINLINANVKADVKRQQQKQTFYLWFIIPVASFTTNSSVNINFPISYIANFNNKKLYASERIYNLQIFIHEFGHAFIGIKKPKDKNSIEEELGVSMIGYNIANKIITGEYLTQEQTKKYSEDCLISLLTDEHRNLPVYSKFNMTIQKYGITMPYPEIYSDIPSMYKKLLSEGKVQNVQTIDLYLVKNKL